MNVFFYRFLLVLMVLFVPEIGSNGSGNDVVLSRRKRYVAFPNGASFVLALCMTAQTIIPIPIFTEGVNWGISYTLPNSTTFGDYKNYFKAQKNMMNRRHRRDLYEKAELVMDSMGFDGRSCILRALCESTRLDSNKRTLSEELVRVLFKFPWKGISAAEPEEHRLYYGAYRRGRENKQQDCAEMFPACSISLVDLALGYYNDFAEQGPHQ